MFQTLADKGTHFIRGQFVLIAAPPGTMKSALTLTEAIHSGAPTFYFSADSDSFTQTARMLSIITGCSMQDSSRNLLNHEWGRIDYHLSGVPIRFSYDASPSLDTIELELKAYVEAHGVYPKLIVVDNITNVRTDGGGEDDDPFDGLEGLCDYLHDQARKTQACVIGLHHTTGAYNNADQPIPMSGIKNQIGRVPEMVLTLHKVQLEDGADLLGVSTVKNRMGRPDPTGQDYATLEFDGDRMLIQDAPMPTVAAPVGASDPFGREV